MTGKQNRQTGREKWGRQDNNHVSVCVLVCTFETSSVSVEVLKVLRSTVPRRVLALPILSRMHPVETFVDLRCQRISEYISQQQAEVIAKEKGVKKEQQV